MEVMVVGTMFFVLMTAIMLVYNSTVRVERQIALKSDIDRTLMAAVRHIDSSLKSSRLVKPLRPDAWTTPEAVESIELEPLKLAADGNPAVTADGFPEWGTPFTISFDKSKGELVRFTPEPRVLANLGKEGSLSFLRPTKGMLRMDVKIAKEGIQGYKSSRETSFQFRLFNQ